MLSFEKAREVFARFLGGKIGKNALQQEVMIVQVNNSAVGNNSIIPRTSVFNKKLYSL